MAHKRAQGLRLACWRGRQAGEARTRVLRWKASRAVGALEALAVILLAACTSPWVVVPAVVDGTVLGADGHRLAYRKVGRGPDVIVIPLIYWNQPRFSEIAEDRTFVFYDPRGRGRSDGVSDPAEFGIDRDLADLDRVIDELGGPTVGLIGTSYYGALVARYAMLHPDRVDRLVLVDALYPRHDPYMDMAIPGADERRDPVAVREFEALRATGVETTDPERYCRAYWRVEGPMTVSDPASLASRDWPCDLPNERPANLSAWGAAVFASLGNWDWTEMGRSVQIPALVLHGTHDLMVPRASSEEWAQVLPQARLQILEHAGHVPWWERPDEVFPLIDAFFDDRR